MVDETASGDAGGLDGDEHTVDKAHGRAKVLTDDFCGGGGWVQSALTEW